MTTSNGLRDAIEKREAAATGATARSLDPWTADGLVRLVGANAFALILIVVGWYQSSGEGTVRTQLSWLELSIAGLIVAGLVNAGWLMRGRRTVSHAMEAVLPPLATTDLTAIVPATSSAAVDGAVRLWVAGTERFHTAECPLIAGKDVRVATAEQRAALAACEVCLDR